MGQGRLLKYTRPAFAGRFDTNTVAEVAPRRVLRGTTSNTNANTKITWGALILWFQSALRAKCPGFPAPCPRRGRRWFWGLPRF